MLCAGLLLGRRAALAAASVSAVTSLGFVYAARTGGLPTAYSIHSDISLWIANTVYLKVVRALAARVLRGQGYQVLEAADGRTALGIASDRAETIDLLLSDVIMPGGTSGRQLAEQLARQGMRFKVLYMSGYTDDAITHHGVLDAGAAFLEKPFSPMDLLRKVREVLET